MAAFANRYARAFADITFAHRLDPNQVVGQLQAYVEMLQEVAELRQVWDNPAVKTDQKIRLLDAIVQRQGTPKLVRNFLAVLIQHGRIVALPEITKQFIAEMDERMGFAQAEIVSARELGAEEKRTLEHQVAQLIGKQVRALYSYDKSLIGGAVVKIGSTIYDGSVRGQLERLRQQLAAS
jgi:F-type H+-transporting ATPase subunit delta